MLVGEAGIGKSRVAEALRDRLGDGCVPLRFQCSPHYVNRALHPMIQHIELAAGIGAEDPAAVEAGAARGMDEPRSRRAAGRCRCWRRSSRSRPAWRRRCRR